MKTKLIATLVLTLFLLSMASVFVPVNASEVEWHVYPGDLIQTAINGASAGDIVVVHEGTYTEAIVVNKPLTLKSKGATIQFTATGYTPAVWVQAPEVTIDGFTVTTNLVGIVVMVVPIPSPTLISEVRITNNEITAMMGISAMYAPNIQIRNNEINAMYGAIFAGAVDNAIVTNNIVHTPALGNTIGISIGGDNCHICDNEVSILASTSYSNGIYYGGSDGIIARNIVSGAMLGIGLNAPAIHTLLYLNTITGASSSGDTGIQLGYSTSENLAMLNTISDVTTAINDLGTDNKVFNNS